VIRARPLNNLTLAHHAGRVEVPRYERERLTPGVVHLSVGSFHRSHQAVYLDDLACAGVRDWGLVGVGLRRPAMREALAAQDGLYTVVARGAEGEDARVVGVMTRYLLAPGRRAEVVATLAQPSTAVVTLTITASGYGGEPHGAVALLVDALAQRRREGLPPFTVISCDNLPDNGRVAHRALVAAATDRDRGLGVWLEARGAFPSGMVDRITPQTTREDRLSLARRFGVGDRWPVMTEPFRQWILEDRFADRRPPLDEVGVQYVDDVRPYALVKTRLLNGSHCALGHLGSLLGYERADEAAADPLLYDYLRELMDVEVTPLLPRVPGLDLAAYKASLLDRLLNPAIGDQLERLCRNAAAKVPAHVLPSIADARRRGTPYRLLTIAVAGWVRYLRGRDDHGRRLPLEDPLAARLRALAAPGGTDPRRLLAERALFGDLGTDARFVAAVAAELRAMERHGTRAAIAAGLAAAPTLAA
jgi:fructuronate reductase/mannitol 2-dehydrogenase